MAGLSPIQDKQSVTAVASSYTFTDVQGAIAIENTGSSDCWFTVNGTPAAGSDGSGRTRLKAGESFADDNLECASIGFICATGLTTTVQIYAKITGGA